MKRKTLFVGALLSAVLCLLCGTAMGECQKVNMLEKSCEYLTDCEGYDYCEYCQFVGTPNATAKVYYNEADIAFVGDAFLVFVDTVLETKQGDIFVEAVAVMHLGSIDWHPLGVSASIYGGTGKYEGVTGWYAGARVPEEGTVASYVGNICWPDEE